jgi:STE24 endopeptidase
MRRAIVAGLAVTGMGPAVALSYANEKFDAAAETERYLATVKGEARAKSDTYFEGGYTLDAIDAGIGVAMAALIMFLGVARGMKAIAGRVTRRPFVHTFVFSVLYSVLTAILTAPFVYYRSFTREHEFGMSNQSFDQWLNESLMATGIGLIVGGIAIALLYKVIRWAGDSAWIWAAGFSVLLAAFGAAIAPVYIQPLFNDYKPMAEGPLKDEILSMARANGIPGGDVFVVDASRQTKRISANVAGLFGTTRIALNDNLLERGTPAEIKAVMGHEMGHYALNHIYKSLIVFTVIFALMFAIGQWLFNALTAVFGRYWGVDGLGDIAGMPLLFGILGFLGYLATPAFNTLTRTQEIEADIFGLNAAREPDGFATIALKLAEYRKLEPGYWEEIVFYTHPSGRNRIAMAMRWKAENLPDAKAVAPASPAEALPSHGPKSEPAPDAPATPSAPTPPEAPPAPMPPPK